MPGELVPLVLLPRFSTYAGADDFHTVAMDVTEYSSAIVNVWRGKHVSATSPTFGVTFQESTDQINWTTCSGTTANSDPGQDTEVQYTATLTKRWFRIKVTIGGTSPAPVCTCWAVGFLEQRLS